MQNETQLVLFNVAYMHCVCQAIIIQNLITEPKNQYQFVQYHFVIIS